MKIKRFIDEQIEKVFYNISPLYYTRPMIKAVKDKNQKDLVGLEIGIDEGLNTLNILKNLDIKKLYLVDPYVLVKYERCVKFDWSEHKQIAIDRLKNYENKINFIFKTSEDAVNDIPNNLDFVYIDGNHDYKYVKRDIELYYPKVKVGGIFGGHDFSSVSMGVVRAVIEYFGFDDLNCEYIDWWVVKK